jgi:hypothetical protein
MVNAQLAQSLQTYIALIIVFGFALTTGDSIKQTNIKRNAFR